jgi:hypothetical protein
MLMLLQENSGDTSALLIVPSQKFRNHPPNPGPTNSIFLEKFPNRSDTMTEKVSSRTAVSVSI